MKTIFAAFVLLLGTSLAYGANEPRLTIGASSGSNTWQKSEYLRSLIGKVHTQWVSLTDDRSKLPPPGTQISVQFAIDREGRITEIIRVNGASANKTAGDVCVAAIKQGAPYGDWPEKLKNELPPEHEMILRFGLQ